MSIKEKIVEEFDSQMDILHDMKLGTDEYKVTVDGITKLADRAIELEKLEAEMKSKNADRELETYFKTQELATAKKENKTRTAVDLVKTVAPIAAAFAMGIISMRWEKVDTLTSTAGKSSLRDLIRFK